MSRTHREHGDRGYIEDQREFFDRLITEDWDTYLNPDWNRTRATDVNQILRLVPSPRKILNIGCGCGFHDLLFAQTEGVDLVVGIDYSEKSIDQANRYYSHPKIQRFAVDCFDDQEMNETLTRYGQFELVVSFQVIEHLSRPRDLLALKAHYTSKTGAVAVVTPNRWKAMNWIRKMFRGRIGWSDPLHFVEYSMKELVQMGKEQGLEVVGRFGGDFDLTCRGTVLIRPAENISRVLGRLLPGLTNTIGIVFRRGISRDRGPDEIPQRRKDSLGNR